MTTTTPERSLLGGRLAGIALLAMVALAYVPALGNGFVWDDDDYVENNQTLRTLAGLSRIWLEPAATPQYYPLVHTSYWLEYRFWELDPRGYHAVNILLHALATLLLWRVLRKLGLPGAWLAAALFGLHPVHVESVAWITERKNVLSGALYFGAALAYLEHRAAAGRRRGGLYLLSLLLYTGALLSKTVTASLPAALLLVGWWKRGRLTLTDLRPLLPFLALGIPLGLVTAYLERHQVGAVGEFWDHSLVEKCLVAGRGLWFYAGKLVWPQDLSFVYPRWRIDPGAALQYLPPAAAAAVVVGLWLLRERLGRGPLVAVLFFAGTLFPALGFFALAPSRFSWVADHFQYLASAGLLALAAAVAARVAASGSAAAPRLVAVAAGLILAVLGTLTWQQTRIYADRETLWRDTLSKNPDSWMPHVNLGYELDQRGALEEALVHYRLALALRPGYVRAHYNLGAVLAKLGEYDEAIVHYQRILHENPDHAPSHFNAANAYKALGRPRRAVHHYREAIRADPSHAGAHRNLGILLRHRGRIEEANALLAEAARLEDED